MKVLDVLEPHTLLESITPQQAVELIGKEAVIDYISNKPVTLLGGKKNEQQGRVTKIVRNWPVKFIHKGDYEAEMRKLPGQEEFTAQAGWGSYQDDGLIEHKGKLYIQAFSIGKGETTYLLDGKPIAKQDIINLPSPPPKPEDSGKPNPRKLEVDFIQLVRLL